jgi:hypothetical protein
VKTAQQKKPGFALHPDALAEGVVSVVEKAMGKHRREIDHLQRRVVQLELQIMELRQALAAQREDGLTDR